MHSIPKIYNLQDLRATLSKGYHKIGLLGGSFNPAHTGHLEISKYAINELGLDCVIWLVAEQNPLKPGYEQTLQERASFANQVANHSKIIVSTMETEIHSKCTYDTLMFFVQNLPNLEFTWLMGADCIAQFHLWENFDKFADIMNMAIFARTGYENTTDSIAWKELLKKHKYSIIFCTNTKIDISSTKIRAAHKMLNSSEELKDFIVKALEEKKAENIVVIDIKNKTSFTQYMIFATGRSTKNISAIADYISFELKHHSSFKTTIEGSGASEWVLLDAGDVVLHLFQEEARERYKVEELWQD